MRRRSTLLARGSHRWLRWSVAWCLLLACLSPAPARGTSQTGITIPANGIVYIGTCRGGTSDGQPCPNATGTCAGGGVCEGITLNFSTGTFDTNDLWYAYERSDIRQPVNPALLARVGQTGKIMCSTCHNQHQQIAEPFDPIAPAYGGSGTGSGRHFQRIANDTNQMCRDCHDVRDVTLSDNGSHPVSVAIPAASGYKAPTSAPLDWADQVQCMSCHVAHGAPTSNGTLAFSSNMVSLCTDCHDLPSTSSHLNASSGVLWPGGQYGSTFPAVTDTGRRGWCTNCHQPHGWPDDATPAQDYPVLLVEQRGDICFTCHDSNGPGAFDAYTAFNPTPSFSGTSGGGAAIDQKHDPVLCAKCHNPHYVTASGKVMNPDNTTVPFTQTYSPANSYAGNSYRSAGTDLNPVNPAGAFDLAAGWKINKPTCTSTSPVCASDHAAASQGTFSGTQAVTFNMTVTTGGGSGTAKFTCTSTPSTGVCSSYATGAYTWTDDTFFPIGLGVQFKVNDNAGGASLTLNEQWTLTVVWADAIDSCASPTASCVETDYVGFCLTCHDGSPPAGVTMTPSMIDVATEYWTKDQHGSIAGNTGTQLSKGYKKMPWTTQAQYTAGQEPAFPYAALQCTHCHDGHGSANLYHLKTSISIANIPMEVGGIGTFEDKGGDFYRLPCFQNSTSNTVVNCDDVNFPQRTQRDHKWGAWCTFCHTMSGHPVETEDVDCQSGHMHGGGNF